MNRTARSKNKTGIRTKPETENSDERSQYEPAGGRERQDNIQTLGLMCKTSER